MAGNCNRSRGPGRRMPGETVEVVTRAVSLRERLFGPFGREADTNAYRLIHSSGDGLDGFYVDAYDGFLVMQVVTAKALPRAGALERALVKVLDPRGIVRKLRYRQTERGQVVEELRGEKPPSALTVREEGIPFEVELQGGLHTGLFTDMREEHARMRHHARGRRVLNTFAYTGAFSVAAAVGGATQVTSVDVVEKVLDRARRNFRLSGIDPDRHHFARMEVLDYIRMAGRRGWRFDAVVLDPPTFATFKSGNWSARKSYPELLERSVALLEPGGLLWAAANTESLAADRFKGMIRNALESAGRPTRTLVVTGLPPDYPTPAADPESRYLKVHVIEVL